MNFKEQQDRKMDYNYYFETTELELSEEDKVWFDEHCEQKGDIIVCTQEEVK
jgi:hypothetical protein